MSVAVFIDNGYLKTVIQPLMPMRLDYQSLRDWCVTLTPSKQLYRTYLYDCMPQAIPGVDPVLEQERNNKAKRFFHSLDGLSRFVVRMGQLAPRKCHQCDHETFHQKRVDLLIGIDIATIVFKAEGVESIVLITGDADIIPAIELAKAEAKEVFLVHGPRNVADDLKRSVDDCHVLDESTLRAMEYKKK